MTRDKHNIRRSTYREEETCLFYCGSSK